MFEHLFGGPLKLPRLEGAIARVVQNRISLRNGLPLNLSLVTFFWLLRFLSIGLRFLDGCDIKNYVQLDIILIGKRQMKR